MSLIIRSKTIDEDTIVVGSPGDPAGEPSTMPGSAYMFSTELRTLLYLPWVRK